MPIANQEYVSQYAAIHQSKAYGHTAREFAAQIQACLLDLRPATVLEYGCGQAGLHRLLELENLQWVRYDPAIAEHARISIESADFVVNTDVMEHIPEADVHDVLAHIRSFSGNAFFSIATRPAVEILPNGENAHCTVWSEDEWLRAIGRHFADAGLVHVHESHSCIITTWKSPVRRIISHIEDLKQAVRDAQRRPPRHHPFKRIERGVRSIRDRILARTGTRGENSLPEAA